MTCAAIEKGFGSPAAALFLLNAELEPLKMLDIPADESLVHLCDGDAGKRQGGAPVEQPGVFAAKPSPIAEAAERLLEHAGLLYERIHRVDFRLGEHTTQRTARLAERGDEIVIAWVDQLSLPTGFASGS